MIGFDKSDQKNSPRKYLERSTKMCSVAHIDLPNNRIDWLQEQKVVECE